MNLDFAAFRVFRAARWDNVKQGFGRWRHQARLRAEFLNLSDRGLQDIGLLNRTVDIRFRRPF